jgi:MFS superfamily sulfate permease-like transporter
MSTMPHDHHETTGEDAPAAHQAGLSWLPITQWLPAYNPSWLQFDLVAGLTLAAIAIPESMAYAGLAGLPPEAGLYASLAAMLIYTLVGSSRQLAVGPTSALAITVASTLGAMALGDSAHYAAVAALTALLVGAIALVAGLLRLGFVANFISESVLTGFSAGAALFIASSQLSKLFGIPSVQGNFFERVGNILTHLNETNGPTLALGIAGIVALLLGERFFPRLPVALIVVLLSILLMNVTNLEQHGVKVAGHIAAGLPAFGLPGAIPTLSQADFFTVGSLAFACFLLSYVEGIAAVRTLAARHKDKAYPNQELLGRGRRWPAGWAGCCSSWWCCS